jgi:hypothetical protein
MRTIRALTIAAAVVAALPTIASAQKGRQFKDSWFWGIKTGGFTFADSGQKYTNAPVVGVDWVITRTHGGLYVSGSQTFFSNHTFAFRDPAAPVDSGFRAISVKNLRRLDVALLGFPGERLLFHPYVGAGFSLGQVATVAAEPPFGNVDQINYAEAIIADERVAVTPLFIGGAQFRISRFSVFGQATFSPAQKRFILYNGRPFNLGYEVGLRYNFGSAIDKDY